MRIWSQCIAAGLAIVTFIVAVLPRNYTQENSRSGSHHLSIWPRLLKFPVFWFGFCLMIYIVIQGLNPAWRYVQFNQSWWMEKIPHLTWLPHGTESPPRIGNQWRSLLVLGTAWLTACSIWIGITRRRSLQIILGGLVISAVLLAIVAAAQRLTHTNEILWWFKSPNQIWGTFFYRNHGAAWFNFMVAVCCALAFWHYLKAMRTFAKSSPAAVYGFLALLMMVAVAASYSRGAVFSLLLFFGLFTVAFFVRQFTLPPYPQKNLITVVLLVLFFGSSVIGLRGLDAAKTWDRMEQLFEGDTNTLTIRHTVAKATFDMWHGAEWFGHGAGSFQSVFAIYQQRHPTIWKAGKRRLHWEHAHNDIAQTLAELGLVGSAFIVSGFLWWLVHFTRLRAWANPVTSTFLFVLCCALLHSWGELIFQCPAILVTWVALGIIGLRWAEFEAQSR